MGFVITVVAGQKMLIDLSLDGGSLKIPLVIKLPLSHLNASVWKWDAMGYVKVCWRACKLRF